MSTGGVLPGSMTLDHFSCHVSTTKCQGWLLLNSPSCHRAGSYGVYPHGAFEYHTLPWSAIALVGYVNVMEPTQTHRDTITIPLRMQHMLFWPQTKISHHLHSLRILYLYMTLFNHALHEILMDQLPECPPQRPILHSQ